MLGIKRLRSSARAANVCHDHFATARALKSRPDTETDSGA
jgi:hypothetical protein